MGQCFNRAAPRHREDWRPAEPLRERGVVLRFSLMEAKTVMPDSILALTGLGAFLVLVLFSEAFRLNKGPRMQGITCRID
jgi:hypothetical protein